jgi:hypothetical protein
MNSIRFCKVEKLSCVDHNTTGLHSVQRKRAGLSPALFLHQFVILRDQ